MDDFEAHLVLNAGNPDQREEACTDLFNRHAPWLIAALEARGRFAPEFAEEGTSTAMYSLFKELASNSEFPISDPKQLQAWLYKAGCDAAIDAQRRVWKSRSGVNTFSISQFADEEEATTDPPDRSVSSPVDLAAARELCQDVADALSTFTPSERSLFLRDM